MPETEGLPLLDVDRVDAVDNEGVNDFSFKNEGFDMLTPLTDGDIPPPPGYHPEAALGMPVEDAIELWQSAGAPIIHLGPGENCFDLEELLSNSDVKREHLEAVKRWLDSMRAKS